MDEEVLRPVSDYFTAVARREGLPIGAPVEYDYSQYLHQVPGGMISNLRHQLARVGLGDHMERALEEVVRVREELGYPIMVTPLSQFVGSQAAINIIVGERYKEVTDQVILYALGRWGREGSETMDAEVKDRILGCPRARELAAWVPPEPTIQELRAKYGGAGVSDEELLLRYFLTREEIDTMRAAGPPRDYPFEAEPVTRLVEGFTQRADYAHIQVRSGGFALNLSRKASSIGN